MSGIARLAATVLARLVPPAQAARLVRQDHPALAARAARREPQDQRAAPAAPPDPRDQATSTVTRRKRPMRIAAAVFIALALQALSHCAHLAHEGRRPLFVHGKTSRMNEAPETAATA